MLNFQQKEIFLKNFFDIIRKCPLFDGINDGDMIKMLTCLGAKVEFFDKKHTVLAEGTEARYIGIVLSGKVQITQVDYYGNRSILSEIYPSEAFAEAFACAEIKSLPVSAVAAEPSEIMLIECSHMLHTCSNSCTFHKQLIYNLMKALATKTIAFHQRIEITSKRSTRDKLLTYLCLQSQKARSNTFRIPFDRQELADYLEVDRSGLSAEISKLKKEGVLDCHKDTFKLL